MIKCQNCESVNDNDAKFCTTCSAALQLARHTIDDTNPKETLKNTDNKDIGVVANPPNPFFILFIFGLFSIVFWLFTDHTFKELFHEYLEKPNVVLWITIHARLITGFMLLLVAFASLFTSGFRKTRILVLTTAFAGLLNMFIDLLAIPAMANYDQFIDIGVILEAINLWWVLYGVVQIGLALYYLIKSRRKTALFGTKRRAELPA